MRLKKMSMKTLSVLMSVIMLFGICAPAIGAFDAHSHANEEKERIVYVSIGDSVTNGFGLDGYDGESGIVNYGKNTYANRFAAWLAGYTDEIADDQVVFDGSLATVDHRQLAMNGMRAEDLRWVLALDCENEALMKDVYGTWTKGFGESAAAERWHDEWGFKVGDFRTWSEFCDGDSRYADGAAKIMATYRNPENKDYFTSSYAKDEWAEAAENGSALDPYYPEGRAQTDDMGGYAYLQIATEFYQRSVKEADVISLALGNANFDTFMLNGIAEAIGGNADRFTERYDIERVFDVAGLDPETENKIRALFEKLDVIVEAQFGGLAGGDPAILASLKNVIFYCFTSYIVNYIGVLEDILAVNPDVRIIQVALVNTYADGKETIGGIAVGDIVEQIHTPVNAFIAALPTYMMATGEEKYEEATFFYAEADAVECLGAVGYPSEDGHDALFEAIRDSYVNEHTPYDQTVNNLRDFIAEYYDDIYEYAYAEAKNRGVIDKMNAYLDEAVEAIRYAEAWAFEYEQYFRSEDFALALRASADDAVATVEALRELVTNAEALDDEAYGKVKAISGRLAENLNDLALLVNTVAADAASYASEWTDNVLKPEIARALAALNRRLDEVQEAVALLDSAVKAQIAAAEALASRLVDEFIRSAEKYLAEFTDRYADRLADKKEELETGLKKLLNEFLNYRAFSADYRISVDSFYLAIGDDTLYAKYLAEQMGLGEDQFGVMDWDGMDPSLIAKADLITVGYSESTVSGFAADQILGYVRNYIDVDLRDSIAIYAEAAIRHFFSNVELTLDDALLADFLGTVDGAVDELLGNGATANAKPESPDWAGLIGEENAACAEELRDTLREVLLKAGVCETYTYRINVIELLLENKEKMDPAVADMLELFDAEALMEVMGDYAYFTQDIPVLDAFIFALESYLYGYVKFNVEYAQLVYAIGVINPEAQVVLLGNHNALADIGLDVAIEDIVLTADMLPSFGIKDSFDQAADALVGIFDSRSAECAVNAVFDALDARMARIYGDIKSVKGYVSAFDFAEAFKKMDIPDIELADIVGEENVDIAKKLIHVLGFILEQEGVCDRIAEEIPTVRSVVSSFCANAVETAGIVNAKAEAVMEEAFVRLGLTLSEARTVSLLLADHVGAINKRILDFRAYVDALYETAMSFEIRIEGVSFDFGSVLGAPALAQTLFYAYTDDRVIFTDISDAQTVHRRESAAEFLFDYLTDPTVANFSEEGHRYIADCIYRALSVICGHGDRNGDHLCDYCGEILSECADRDSDHLCDLCGKILTDCINNDGDHLCDICGKVMTACADTDGNHLCDICGNVISACADADGDHLCDLCGKTLSECADADGDHLCDLCGKTLSVCADADNDHKCDLCGKTLSECADTDGDHLCDLCGKTLSECADADNDHKCDLCGKTLSACADADNDHKCDLCGNVISACADENGDHKCDLCGAVISECADLSRDHKCDVCGAVLSTCSYGDWIVSKEATRKEEGERYCECVVCGDRIFEVIPKYGLPVWAVIAISVGTVAILCGAGFAVYWFIYRKKKSAAEIGSDEE